MVKKASSPSHCFGVRLRQARERMGLPQDKLGVLIGLDEGCSSARISRYETGIHQPAFEIARNLAQVLGVCVTYFYCEDDWLADVVLRIGQFDAQQRTNLDAWLADKAPQDEVETAKAHP